MALADDDFYYPRDLEESFCRDFSCCGLILNDLHDLLQHYEECHVRFEDDEAQQDLGDDCFFDEEWAPVSDCLSSSTAVHNTTAGSDLASYGLSLEQQLLLGAATAASATTSSTAVPSPELAAKDTTISSPADTLLHKATTSGPKGGVTPPLSPSGTASSSAINSPHEGALPFPIDTALANRKRTAGVSVAASPASSGDQSPIKRRATFSNPKNGDGGSGSGGPADLGFPSSVLGLYDDDIIAAIASATDPLFLSGAAAASANGQKSIRNTAAAAAATLAAATKHSDIVATSASLAEAATAAVNAVTANDDSDDCIHLPPSVTAAMAGAVAAAAAAKAHGFLPRDDKPFRCPIANCDKAYKNPNGLKYHNQHGHCSLGEDIHGSSKPYKCRVPECYKAYKNLNGLKYHVQHAHCAMIPSLGDLSPNASPGEVAAAVAAAAAAAAATAASTAVSSAASPSFASVVANSSAQPSPAASPRIGAAQQRGFPPHAMQKHHSSPAVSTTTASSLINNGRQVSGGAVPRMGGVAAQQQSSSVGAVRKGPVAAAPNGMMARPARSSSGTTMPNMRSPQNQQQRSGPMNGPRPAQSINRRPQQPVGGGASSRPISNGSAQMALRTPQNGNTGGASSSPAQTMMRRPLQKVSSSPAAGGLRGGPAASPSSSPAQQRQQPQRQN
ncbi:Transcriptional regulator of ribosomal biogenesis proteins, partial [Coemansia sp. RSA 1933]